MRSAGYVGLEFKAPHSNPSVKARVALTNARLRNAHGDVRVIVSPNCKELIKDLEEVCFKANSEVIDKEKDSKRTHLSDALGYLLWREFGDETEFGEKTRPLF
jgi:hypothetical protein